MSTDESEHAAMSGFTHLPDFLRERGQRDLDGQYVLVVVDGCVVEVRVLESSRGYTCD